jgi:hypothetical protein
VCVCVCVLSSGRDGTRGRENKQQEDRQEAGKKA